MSFNILESVRESLNYPPLQRVDPNTQEVPKNKYDELPDKFGQAAIPAVLTGLYRYVQSDEGAEEFLSPVNNRSWVEKIFSDHTKEIIDSIAIYANVPRRIAARGMNVIAKESIRMVREKLHHATPVQVKRFFHHQINTILLYLPAEVHTGEWLHYSALDDNINKMKGPISSLVQGIGAAFSNPESGK